MCGIVGYIGCHAASPVLLEGLRRLEYRGYDSAGVALLDEKQHGFTLHKRVGRVANVVDAMGAETPPAKVGISHTRWATHGAVTEHNAHPHLSWDGQVMLVHNGVIENYQVLRRNLEQQGVTFRSETDSEVLTNLIALSFKQLDGGRPPQERLLEAVRQSLAVVEGTYGIAVMAWQCPDRILVARKGSPLCIGVGNDEYLIASDVSAFLGRTRSVVYLEDGQVAVVGAKDFQIATIAEAAAVEAVIQQIDWQAEDAEIGGYDHFMEKEIFEQPQALENAMRGRFSDDGSTAKFGGLNLAPREWRQIERLVFCACGTARHACLVAEHLIETYARIPVEVEYASEFRYRNAPLDKDTMVFVMSQSGETIDTLEALREAHRKGHRVLGITNGVGSTIARETEGGIYQHAGPEIGVASTKA
ncbi:MAG: glutamine--fructose-6-phosphate transaminase (isomerizing), partial [Opitutales bacterium]